MTRVLFIKPLKKKKLIIDKYHSNNIYIVIRPNLLPNNNSIYGYLLLLHNSTLPYSNIDMNIYIKNYLKLEKPKLLKTILYSDSKIHYIVCNSDNKKYWIDSKVEYVWRDHYILSGISLNPISYKCNNFITNHYEIAEILQQLLLNI